MNQTENINELVAALAKAQGKMQPAVFNKSNSHFKQKYADFTSVMDACRAPLADNGLAIMQYCETINEKLMLVTMLAHVSGQWIKSCFPLLPKTMDSQGIGSSLTYAKRYCLSALLGIVSDEDKEADDDGEAAMGRGKPPEPLRINASQAHTLQVLKLKISKEAQDGFDQWLNKIHRCTLDTLPIDQYEKVIKILNDKIEFEAKNEKN